MPPILIDDYPYSPRTRYGHGLAPSHPRLFQILDADRPRYRDVLAEVLSYRDHLIKIQLRSAPEDASPAWINDFLPGLDSAVLYSLVSSSKADIYMEIGSGNSTKFVRRAIQDQGLSTKIVSIDPHPREEIDQLCDEVIRQPVEEVSLDVFSRLKAGDILFVDHSHRSFMNSDTTIVFLDILPELKPGVLVQIHDIYLPWDYPPEWIERHYNEQYLLACYLLANPRFEVVLPATFVSIDPELSQLLAPLWTDPRMIPGPGTHGASFWLRTL
ncbi:MAG: class I SAM-dependent methyltransferase [Bryobacteraceae bacterium]